MKKLFLVVLAFLGLATNSRVYAQDFFDTSDAEKFFTFGARVGVNTSNRTFPKGNYLNYMMSSWGTGFDAGVVANMNFKEYLSIQPGFFFESRSGNLLNIVDYLQTNINGDLIPTTHYEVNHLRAYYFTVPIMGIVNFNIADNVKWMVEFGPYFQFCLKEKGQDNVEMLSLKASEMIYNVYMADHRGFDIGLKMGTGLKFYSHYYVGVHYMAGLTNAWHNPSGGRNKSWVFSIGYDF